MKFDPSPDPFYFHDQCPRDVAGEAHDSGEYMPPPNPDEVRFRVGGDKRTDFPSDGCPVLSDPDIPGCQVTGQGHINQKRHEENVWVHRPPD